MQLDDILYPAIEPYHTQMLKVSDLHSIYVEESGNPNGKPVLFVHGGPGGGTHPNHRRFFNPSAYRIILVDQRGCGKSSPHAETQENTTQDLVTDFEKIRIKLNIEKWQVFGGSWGSTLGLAYAQAHPERVTELVLRGIFLGRPQELQFFYQHGTSEIFPDAWDNFIALIPENERHDIMAAYQKRLTGTDKALRYQAALAWSIWEGSTSKLFTDPSLVDQHADPEFALAFARIENHYFMNQLFLKPNQLLNGVSQIRTIPGVIVQGRYDVVCPMVSAWELHKAWPEAELNIVPDAGHSAMETGIALQLVKATNRFMGVN